MGKYNNFRYLRELEELSEGEDAEKMLSLLTAEDLRTLRDPDSFESRQLLELLKSRVH